MTSDIDTPALLIDRTVLRRNIASSIPKFLAETCQHRLRCDHFHNSSIELMLFVLADGWHLVVETVLYSFA